MTDDRTDLIDWHRSACLCDLGCDYLAATVVEADGHTRLVLAERNSINDPIVRYDPAASQAIHEQLGPLPDDIAHRLRAHPHRCGRPTKTTGRPCRIEVTRPGQPCGLHRAEVER